MKKKDPKDQKTEFQEASIDDDFKQLMRKLGVRKLKQAKPATQETKSGTGDDHLEFIPPEKSTFELQLPKRKLKFTKPELQSKTPSPKKRKKISPDFIPDAELDLHGLNRFEALQKINQLVALSRKQKYKVVLIITGRGLSSEQGEGILRKVVWNWLQEHQTDFQFNCRWAPEFLGGKGAILVFFN